jgi:glycine cleavage system aminomethyltransferase T
MTEETFQAPLATPFYRDRVLYQATDRGGTPWVRAWRFNGWRPESLSWKTGCYIHAGLSSTGPLVIKGPGAKAFLESLCINSFRKFSIGAMKHAVMCDEDGLIACHGILERKGEQTFELFAAPPWPMMRGATSGHDVSFEMRDDYLFQIAGPTSLKTLEAVTGESLKDVGFLRFRDSRIGGAKVEVARIGMTGGLAYELHGPIADAAKVYDAVYETGKAFGIERLGWGTYLVNHIEGGFPQITWTFIPVTGLPEDQARAMARAFYKVSGSVDPAHLRARHRTPVEVGWHGMCKFDHDFLGRPALEAETAHPKRTVVTLRWNTEDVIDIHASLFRPEEPYKTLDLPYAPQDWPQAHADWIVKDGRPVGISSGTIYSYWFREALSMGCLDVDLAQVGTEVVVQWGDFGGRIKDVRATVERYPYLVEGRNSDVDASLL